jgi:hypothetical protein
MKHSILHVADQSDATSAALDSMKKIFQKHIPKNVVQYSIGPPRAGTLPLIRALKEELPTINQPWYADDAGAGETFAVCGHPLML